MLGKRILHKRVIRLSFFVFYKKKTTPWVANIFVIRATLLLSLFVTLIIMQQRQKSSDPVTLIKLAQLAPHYADHLLR